MSSSAAQDASLPHTSIDLDAFDNLVFHASDDDFSSPGAAATAFTAMDSSSFVEKWRARRADRSSTRSISTQSASTSFLASHGDASSSSLALSNNSILCASPADSELDFSGVHIFDGATLARPALQRPPTDNTQRPRESVVARQSRLMGLRELHQLRECLMKGSIDGHEGETTPWPTSVTAKSDTYRFSLDAEEKQEDDDDASFVAQLPPPVQLTRLPSAPKPMASCDGATRNMSESSLLSSTHTLPDELLGVMPLPRCLPSQSSPPSSSLPKPTPSAMPMPRESVAVLIDAVRASALREDDKCRFVFDLFDVAKLGVLNRAGVAAFVEATLLANNLHCYGDFRVHELLDKLFAATGEQQHMTYNEFRCAFHHTVASPARPLAASADFTKEATAKQDAAVEASLSAQDQPPSLVPQEYRPSVHFRPANVVPVKKKNFWQRVVVNNYRKYDAETHWLAFYGAAMVAAFAVKAARVAYDPAAGHAPRIAKGAAQVVMVDAFLLLLPVCRRFVTFVRQFVCVTSRVPVDKHVEFHKIAGIVMLVAALVHTAAWVVLVLLLRDAPDELWQQSQFHRLAFVRDETPLELMQRVPMWTGFAMVLIAAVAAPLTLARVRRGSFNAFWMSHLLFVPFLLLLLVHGLAQWVQPPQAFWWIVPPLALYLVEKRVRLAGLVGGHTTITRVHFSQDTVAIFMAKPEGFHFHPGMYLYLKVPVISRFEWHPFTISSAPEDACLSIHVRKAGDWTGALHEMLRTIKGARQGNLEADDALPHLSPYPTVCLDGPVGAPSQDYYRYKSVVFVGAGIGVTPFASILRSIVHQWEAFRCPCCTRVSFPRKFQIQKIYFYWITREQEALTWFTETMNQLSELDTEGRLEIHNYFSPLKRESVVAPLRALQTFIHDAEGQDIISGLATKQVTHFGRPDWKQELSRIAQQQREWVAAEEGHGQHPTHREQSHAQDELQRRLAAATARVAKKDKHEEIAVFFCGPKTMGSAIHDECASFNAQQRGASGGDAGVSFDFRNEQF